MSMKTLRSTFIGDRALYKRVLAVAVPIMVQTGITNFVSLLDNIMVGRIGTEQMSGVAIVNQLLFVYYLCVFGGFAGAGISAFTGGFAAAGASIFAGASAASAGFSAACARGQKNSFSWPLTVTAWISLLSGGSWTGSPTGWAVSRRKGPWMLAPLRMYTKGVDALETSPSATTW